MQDRIIDQIDISHYMIDDETLNLVIPGDLVTADQGFMNGHGTYKVEGRIYASVMGVVEVTNKLIMVNPLKSKYTPQIGDIIVGRVQEIANKRWRIDIKASGYGYLSLNSTYIPEQRKKNEEDEFNMRKIMQQGDLIVAQVHSINNDKSFNLHTRNPKYGRLQPGALAEVSHRLIKRQKHHMINIGDVGIILGNNGNIFLSNFKRNVTINVKEEIKVEPYTKEQVNTIAILNNILRVLGNEGLQISQLLLKQLLEYVSQREMQAFEVIEDGRFREQLMGRVRERIPKRIEQITSALKKT